MADNVVIRGVWLDEGRLDREVEAIALDCQQAVAEKGREDVLAVLARDLKTRRPYYETKVVADRAGLDYVVNDSRVVYGPWLEGTSERNRSTHFPGYRQFRRSREQLNGQIPGLVAAVVRRHLERSG